MAYGFPTFPCAGENCPKRAGIKGGKCMKCRDAAGAFKTRPTNTERDVDSYLLQQETRRNRMSRRDKK